MTETIAHENQPLDELMQAMDVVDTLRHRANIVERELREEERSTRLIERLREIYRNQGIDVPDRILLEGVAALKEDRFKYDPPQESLSVKLARAYITRNIWGQWILIGIGALIAVAVAWYAFVERPRIAEIAAKKRELTEVLPNKLDRAYRQALPDAKTDNGRKQINDWYNAGKIAISAQNSVIARKAADKLETLATELRLKYSLTVISRPGESSGVWRVPDINPNARNFYLLVEALDELGHALELPIKNEEDGRTYNVRKWGVRVSSQVFDQIRRDKSDDGIIQNNQIAIKRRGYLKPEYLISVEEGRITRW